MSYADINRAKAERTAVFKDTVAFYAENPVLAESTAKSVENTTYYSAEDYPEIPGIVRNAGKVAISTDGSFTAAMRLSQQYPEKKICVLNFASATKPGGGVVSGSSAQEECLCRCSTLYPTLKQARMNKLYYAPNKAAKNNLHTDECIYSPGVVICKTDTKLPERLPEEDWVTVDVISCAAPNLQQKVHRRYSGDTGEAVTLSDMDLYNLHLKRARHICTIAAANGVDVLILGAFGCGAFKNNPDVVAKAYAKVLEEFRYRFEHIEFPILGSRSGGNYIVFANALKNLIQQ